MQSNIFSRINMTVLTGDRLTLKCEVPGMVTELDARNMVLVPP